MGDPGSGHRPRRRFGQNFLHDTAVLRRMVASIRPKPGQAVVEIGPGKGALTVPLLEAAGRLVAVELDRDLVPLVKARCAGTGDLEVINTDALTVDFHALAAERGPLRVVGNLPYNVSTPILFHLLAASPDIVDLHLLLQREVVQRMAAPPGSKARGRLSVMVQYRCTVERLFDVPPGAFHPVPKVTSTFVRLTPHREPPVAVADEKALAAVVTAAFGGRRKTLRNSLKGIVDAEAMARAGVDPGRRAEELTLDEFARLAQCL